MDIQEIYGLMDRFEASGIQELEVEFGGAKVKMKKGGPHPETTALKEASASVQRAVVSQSNAATVQSTAEALTEVKAPLVGTFYRAPSPDDKPFVMVGQEVKKGDVLGIIEAMKLMNEIIAPEDGVVESILAENSSMVEFHQVLMTLSKGK